MIFLLSLSSQLYDDDNVVDVLDHSVLIMTQNERIVVIKG